MTPDKQAYLDSITKTLPNLTETNEFGKINGVIVEMLEFLCEDLNLPKNPDMLELGSGPGDLSTHIHNRLKPGKFVSVDFSEEMVQEVKKQFAAENNVEVLLEDIVELRRGEASSDIIVSSFTFHHIVRKDRAAVFARCHQWLRPRGMLVIGDVFEDEDPFVHGLIMRCHDQQLIANGMTDEKMALRREHRALESRGSVSSYLDDLRAAGFEHVWCALKQMERGVVVAIR